MLELKQRVFTTDFAKVFCRKIYRFPINKATWGNWRRWSGIPARSRECSYEQLCFIVAIAYMRAEAREFGDGYYQELKSSDVENIATSPSFQQMIAEGISFIDGNGLIAGRDIPRFLRITGNTVTSRTLYRKIPGFSLNKVYKFSDIETAIYA